MSIFSIITPTYNRSGLLPRMIESVRKQAFADWELIIVDDGSTDDTSEVIGKYAHDSRIKYIKKYNSGAADSRNVGADSATGTFLVFLDSDDEALEGWLDHVAVQIKADTGLVCVAAKRNFDNVTRIVDEPLFESKVFGEVHRLKFNAGSLFVRKALFNQAGKYDKSMLSNHHTDLGFRLMQVLKESSLKVVSIDIPLVKFNIHDGARIRTNWGKVRDGSLMFIEKHHEFMIKNDRKGISNFYAVIAFSNYKLNERKECFKYLFKAINTDPASYKNYIRVFKYIF